MNLSVVARLTGETILIKRPHWCIRKFKIVRRRLLVQKAEVLSCGEDSSDRKTAG